MEVEMKPSRYRLYDEYDGRELLGSCSTLHEVRRLSKERHNDTDGEWLPMLYKWDAKVSKYVLVPTWSY